MKIRHIFAAYSVAVSLGGCAIGQSNFSCGGLPEGVTCMSAKDVYAATNKASSVRGKRRDDDEDRDAQQDTKASNEVVRIAPDPAPTVDRPIPVRTQPVVMRMWVAPYQTDKGDLFAGGIAFREIEPRKWNIAATQVMGAVGGGKVMAPLKQGPINAGLSKKLLAPLKEMGQKHAPQGKPAPNSSESTGASE
jgi:conjugal transfer pilus assembly protein TraV